MTPYIRALRAITATVFQRVYRPIVWVIGGILLFVWIGLILLTSMVNPWWGVLFVVLVPVTIVFVAVAAVLWALSQRLFPRVLMRNEKRQIISFSDKLLRVAEVRATPVPLVAFFIAKDLVRNRKSSYIENILSDTTSLKDDFTSIRNFFI